MKRTINIIAILLIGLTTMNAQENLMNTIESYGTVSFEKEISQYRAKIVLSLDQVYYDSSEFQNFKELRDTYFAKLKSNGIDVKKLKENRLEYLSYNYRKEGSVYTYETESLEQIETLLSVKMQGVTSSTIEYKVGISQKAYENYLSEALKEAKKNAETIANKAGKKVGDIVKLYQITDPREVWASYYNRNEYLQIKVTYELL